MEFIIELLKNLALGAAMGTAVALIIKINIYVKEKRKKDEELKREEEEKPKKATFIEKMLEN